MPPRPMTRTISYLPIFCPTRDSSAWVPGERLAAPGLSARVNIALLRPSYVRFENGIKESTEDPAPLYEGHRWILQTIVEAARHLSARPKGGHRALPRARARRAR